MLLRFRPACKIVPILGSEAADEKWHLKNLCGDEQSLLPLSYQTMWLFAGDLGTFVVWGKFYVWEKLFDRPTLQ